MKHKTSIYILILILTTFVGFWGIPKLVKTATYSPDRYPFVYYSSLLKELCLIDFKNDEFPMRDVSGNVYNQHQFDSLLPLFNFRQLASEGKLPKEVDGHEINMPLLNSKSIVYRYEPNKFFTPDPGLYIMSEALPKRVKKTTPEDVFRLTDRIEFINTASNSINVEKSDRFRKELLAEGYSFPAQWVSGDMNPMKPYEEGFFSLDADGKFYQIKMVNSRPFVRNTHVGDSIDIAYFSMMEMGDKRFYGFLYDKSGNIYIIEEGGGKYTPIKLEIAPIDINTDKVLIMGNLLYWTVTTTKPDKQVAYGLKTESLERVAEYTIERETNKWDIVSKWLFPAYLTFEQKYVSGFIYPVFNFTGFYVFIVNFILAVGVFFLNTQTTKKRIFNSIYILITGIVGLIALLILPEFRKRI
ncbi:MAG: DUF4857 domain-containing protein [Prevotella sp.]|jgi:hypothetical protein|nr:DUF4857 domain-containing protein [Prevotella sp.]